MKQKQGAVNTTTTTNNNNKNSQKPRKSFWVLLGSREFKDIVKKAVKWSVSSEGEIKRVRKYVGR